MDKWAVGPSKSLGGAVLLENSRFVGGFDFADKANEIARKMNAFDELIDAMENVCDFLNGEGDVAQIAYRNLRAAITKAEGD